MSAPVSTSEEKRSSTASSAAGSWAPGATEANAGRTRSPRQRGVARLLLGVVLVAASVAVFVVIAERSDDRQPVLALARPVGVGHVLAADDLRVVNIAMDAGVSTIPSASASTVVGRTLATSLPAGSLLTQNALGQAMTPEPGKAIAALALEPGRVPPDLAAGAHVIVVRASSSGATSVASEPEATSEWPATVTGVQPQSSGQVTVVSAQVDQTDAREIAASAADELSLVQVAADTTGGR